MDLQEFNAFIFKNKKDLLNEYYNILSQEVERLKKSVVEDKNWLEKQPIMQDFLTHLQFSLQEKNIHFFSSLMTALSNDVIFNEENLRSQSINFDLYVKGGMPALKINAKTFENNFEKITSGGLKNTIATGLRVLALWRLTANIEQQSNKGEFSHRRFIFLDEPDCWIANESMPNYAKLLHQLSNHFNLQILMVTHKNMDFFKPYATVYEITKNNSYSEINLLSKPSEENPIENYEIDNEKIESIQLKNLKVFKDTTFELDKRLTIIVGKSFTGKSVIMEAFNAVLNNDSYDEIIRHHENKASVILNYITNIQPNNQSIAHSLLWERVKKTNVEYPQKVRYRLYKREGNESTLLNDEFNSHNTPDFATQSLKMKKIDGVDIHLGMQEDMNFLFNPEISDQERAKILSLGKESSYINKMMTDLKTKTREIKSQIKINEKRYNLLLENIINLEEIDPNDEVYHQLLSCEKTIAKQNEQLDLVIQLINKINYFAINQDLDLTEIKINQSYKIHDLKDITRLIQTIFNIEYIAGLDITEISLDFNEKNKDRISHRFKNIERADKLIQTLSRHQEFELSNLSKQTYQFKPLDNLDKIGILIKKTLQKGDELKNQLKEKEKEKKEIKEKIHILQDELGLCPLCQNKFH